LVDHQRLHLGRCRIPFCLIHDIQPATFFLDERIIVQIHPIFPQPGLIFIQHPFPQLLLVGSLISVPFEPADPVFVEIRLVLDDVREMVGDPRGVPELDGHVVRGTGEEVSFTVRGVGGEGYAGDHAFVGLREFEEGSSERKGMEDDLWRIVVATEEDRISLRRPESEADQQPVC
jgi:hypothetical protein